MRVRVDRERCFGYGRCVDLVPEVFHLDDDDKSVADDTTDVAASRLAMAVWACPMQALTLIGDDGQEVSPGDPTASGAGPAPPTGREIP